MTTDEELQSFLEELTALQQDFDAKCARLRSIGLAAQDELRRLRDEAQDVHLKVYTEPEAAEVLRLSSASLARLRESEGLPHFRAGTLVRYTNKHLAEITELLVRRGKGKRGRR
jgi:hypothetical protein